jgi:ElaB/YqjD/DUF883 family membrane-anchored ribosome-binding protein
METFFKNMTPEEGTAEKLLQDLRTLRADTEELFKATGGKIAEKSKAKFYTAMDRVKDSCHTIQDKAVASARRTDRFLHQYPYSGIGVAFGVGLIVGVLIARPRRA